MTTDPELQLWLAILTVVAAYVLVRHWRSGHAAGLVFTYVFSFAAIHLLSASIYLLPWYVSPTMDHTIVGLRISAIALLAFAVGGEWGASLFRRFGVEATIEESEFGRPVTNRTVNFYIVGGAIFYGGAFPIVARLPTASALAAAASSLMVVGVSLKAWNGWQRGRPSISWFWLCSSAVFPIVTLVGQGFLGFGFSAMVVVAAFVASFYRPKWQVVVAALLVGYLGLSVYVTYMRDRRDIRAVVWGGEDVGTRIDTLIATFASTEWFDIQNVEHLRRIDDRLNQDALVGAAVEGIQSEAVPLAYGGTILDAGIALVPRVLWPDKPVVAGSGDIVSIFTGYNFAEGTSVGVGHVMEWYINFAMPGILAGFVLLGAAIVYIDRSAAVWLYRGDIGRFSMWFLPGLTLLQVGGSFAEMTSSAAACFVIAWLLNRMTVRWDEETREDHALEPLH